MKVKAFFFFKDGQRIGRERAAAVKGELEILSRPKFLAFSTTDILGWTTPCGGVCPAPCRAVGYIPGLHPLDGSSTFTYIRGVMA